MSKSLSEIYYNDIIRISRSINPKGWEDLAHDVVLKIHDNINQVKRIETQGKIIPWLFTITKNIHLDSIRTKKEHICIDNLQIKIAETKDPAQELKELIKESGLNHIECLWVDAFIKRNLMSSWVESDLKISRACAKDRLEHIKLKMKLC